VCAVGLDSLIHLKVTMIRSLLLAGVLLTGSPGLAHAQNERQERIDALLPEIDRLFADAAAREHIPGVAYGIMVDGKLIHVRTLGVADVAHNTAVAGDTEFRIASMTKSFVAMAAMRLRDQGKLKLDDPVSKYLPEAAKLQLPTSDSRPITIANLMTMTTGLPEDNPWGDRQMGLDNVAITKLVGAGLSFSNAPDVAYEYSNLGYVMLGKLVSKVSGMRFQDYITRDILLPLGMTHTRWEYSKTPPGKLALGYQWVHGKWELEPILHDGDAAAMGGLITTVEDLGRYMAFHLDAWPARNSPERGPLRRASVREMQQPRSVAGFNAGAVSLVDQKPNPSVTFYAYGLRWNRDARGTVMVSHTGGLPGYGSIYQFAPDYGIGVIAFSNLRYGNVYKPTADAMDILVQRGAREANPVAVSPILAKRQAQLVELIQHWDPALGEATLADNFFLDRSRADWITESKTQLDDIGKIVSIGPMKALNQLRGSFELSGDKGKRLVVFTMSPERDPKVQFLRISKP
jgi:CubicO group peptidase (beta-lactamase class C family)